MVLVLGLCLIGLAIVLVARGLDVRLVLLGTALALGALAGLGGGERPPNEPPPLMRIVQVFFETFANERFVVPICTAMGFAYVMRLTQCDQHLVHLLVHPLTHVRFLLLPGTVLIGFLVNIPVVSQTSTAATLGPVIIPILQRARFSAVTIGAALLLGSSIGGELLNPGAPELRTVVQETHEAAKANPEAAAKLTSLSKAVDARDCVRRILPLNLIGLAVATLVFWIWAALTDRRQADAATMPPLPPDFRVNPLKAFIPVLPLALLFLTAPPLELIKLPVSLLVKLKGLEPEIAEQGLFDSRLIGLAMMIGAAVAAVVVWRKALGVVAAFCEGAGYGFAHIISLIVVANCFGEGIRQIKIDQYMGHIDSAALLLPLAAIVCLAFATLCGSGMATTQSLFKIFAEHSLRLGVDPVLVGAVVALASASGRTMSPAAAVALLCATLTKTNSFELSRRVAVPLFAGVTAIVLASVIMAGMGW